MSRFPNDLLPEAHEPLSTAQHEEYITQLVNRMKEPTMSWSASAAGTKADLASGLIDNAPTSPMELDEHMAKQHAAARVVALQLIEQVPGPIISVTMNGHANGVGEQEKPGWANDYITVTVTQVTK